MILNDLSILKTLNEVDQKAKFFEHIIRFGIFLVYNCSSNRFEFFLVNYGCSLKHIEKI